MARPARPPGFKSKPLTRSTRSRAGAGRARRAARTEQREAERAAVAAPPRHRWLPPLALTLVALVAGHVYFWPSRPVDIDAYLLPWLGHIREHGQLGAFAIPFSNYNPPYLYLLSFASSFSGLVDDVTLIKALSVAGTLALSLSVWRLLAACGAGPTLRLVALLPLHPTVMTNAAMLAQCDAMWSACCLTALTAAIRRKPAAMLVWAGIAFAFKAQAMFFAPFALAWLIAEKVPLRLWLLPLVSYAAMLLPALLAGWPPADLATIYLRQADHPSPLSWNAPNLWALVQELPGTGDPAFVRLAFAAALLAGLVYVLAVARRRLDAPTLVLAALVSALIMPGLLPRMHERFFFLADALAFAFAACRPGWRSRLILVAVQAGSAMALEAYLSGQEAWLHAGALASMAGTLGAVAMLASTLRAAARPPAPDGGAPAKRHARRRGSGLVTAT
jgi:Gpi18-like mannosyltransferase